MIPISTINNPTRRTPYFTYGLILVNVVVFLWELTQPWTELGSTFYALSVVPCDVARNFFSFETVLDILRGMFLHAGWMHLLGNMLYLWIFGTNVEDYYGWRWFLGLYVISGFAAALVQTLLWSHLCVPMVGASGAISGVLGSFLILYPGVRVRVGTIFYRSFVVPAFLVLGIWFILQVFNGIASLGVSTISHGGVAFWAHIGGFLVGALIAFVFTLFVPPPRVVGLD
jgi:membrane associated rhomboid family serine protease